MFVLKSVRTLERSPVSSFRILYLLIPAFNGGDDGLGYEGQLICIYPYVPLLSVKMSHPFDSSA
jgi:hypothetical protein